MHRREFAASVLHVCHRWPLLIFEYRCILPGAACECVCMCVPLTQKAGRHQHRGSPLLPCSALWWVSPPLTFPGGQVLSFCPLVFSGSVVSDSLRPHGPQHAGPPRPSPSPGVYSDSAFLESVMPPSQLILCRPLLLLPSILPSARTLPAPRGELQSRLLLPLARHPVRAEPGRCLPAPPTPRAQGSLAHMVFVERTNQKGLSCIHSNACDGDW